MQIIETQEKKGLMGFTLIELSIVLVIIGLIVGGVLVGQDLIKAAEVRATIGQYEKYNTAINTFRTKYNGMPGDLDQTQATAFGLFATSGTTTGKGDGNGLIQDPSGTAAQLGEPLIFWRHMSDASLIDGSYGSGTNITASSGAAAATTASTYFPAAKLGRGNYFAAGSASGLNYYLLGQITAQAAGDATYAKGLTPIEAFNIDTKLDDGLPNTGSIQARGTATALTLFDTLATGNASQYNSTPASGDCQTGSATAASTTNTYSRGSTAGNGVGCILRLRFN